MNPQTDETITNKVPTFLLTSIGHPPYDSRGQMLMEPTAKSKKDSRKAAYPLRFKNKTQKERLERAARKSGKSLRDFILYHAELAASGIGETQTT